MYNPTILLTDSEHSWYRINFLYHFTHVDNMPSILERGLLSHNEAHRIGCVMRDISDPRVQSLRANKQVFGRSLHDYVPLYFTPRNAMLYVRRNIQSDVVILCLNSILLEHKGSVFTDGNAASSRTTAFNDLRELNKLDWECIRSRAKWIEFPDGRRKRCAEVLITTGIPINHIQRIIVRTEATRRILTAALSDFTQGNALTRGRGNRQAIQLPNAEIAPRWYFDD